MDTFKNLLETEKVSVERFVRFRISAKADADDVLQEVFLTAYQNFSKLKKKDSFKAWIISIARNKCNDYFRKKAVQYEIPIDELTEEELSNCIQRNKTSKISIHIAPMHRKEIFV